MNGSDPSERALSAAQPSIAGIDAVRGHGAWLEAADGRMYLDLVAGIATCNLGHSHPAVIAAVLHQMEQIIHLGGVCGHAPAWDLADRLAESRLRDRALSLLHHRLGGQRGRDAAGSHGDRPARAGLLPWQLPWPHSGRPRRHDLKGGLPAGAWDERRPRRPVPRPDELSMSPDDAAAHALAELDQLHRHQLAPEETACYMIEPVQGHGGCHPAGRRFPPGPSRACRRPRGPARVRRIQTRLRTHRRLVRRRHLRRRAGRHDDGQGARRGFPLSGIGARSDVMSAMRAGDHGSTFGGNPVSCAAALAGINAMEAEGLPEHARALGAHAIERLQALERRHPELRVRGLGLMIGMEVFGADRHTPRPEAAAGIQRRALAEGVLMICSAPEGNVIRVLPRWSSPIPS